MINRIILTYLVLIVISLAQTEESYIVSSEVLNLRSGPGNNFNIITKLWRGTEVQVLNKNYGNWWAIQTGNNNGFVYSKFLDEKTDHYKDWTKKNFASGQRPCSNIQPKFDYEIDNYLKIKVGTHTDVVVKLMKIGGYNTDDICYRLVYIRKGDTFKIRNIPQGKYYLKIAYGKDWRQKVETNRCTGRFVIDAIYEKGEEILDFNLINKPDTIEGDYRYKNWEIPLYELFLDVITTFRANEFDTDKITEEEFNN